MDLGDDIFSNSSVERYFPAKNDLADRISAGTKKNRFQRSRWRRSPGICWPRRSCAAEIGLAFRRRRSQAPGRDNVGRMHGGDVWRQATSGPLRTLVELADFEVVGHTLSFSAHHDGGRARRGAAANSAAAGANAGLVLAPACALHARLWTACRSLGTSDAQLHRVLRCVEAVASPAHRLKALGTVRVMDQLRGCVHEEDRARF